MNTQRLRKIGRIALTGVLAAGLIAGLATPPCYADDIFPGVQPHTDVSLISMQDMTTNNNSDSFPLHFRLRTDFFSKYVFKGFTNSEGSVVQQTLSAEWKGLSLTGWGNFDTANDGITEVDVVVDYTHTFKDKLTLSFGYGYYMFPNSLVEVEPSKLETALTTTNALLSTVQSFVDPEYVPPEEESTNPQYKKATITTHEIYASLTAEIFLKPTLLVAHDFDEGRGTYVEASVSHDFDLGEKVDLSTRAALGYNDHYFKEKSGLSHAEFNLSLPLDLTPKISLIPSINYSKALDDDFEDELFFGLGFEVKL